MRTVLITGAAGFIGRHLVEVCIQRGWQVVGIDRNPPRIDPALGYEHIVHLITAASPLPLQLRGRRMDAAALLAWPIDPRTYLETHDNLSALAATVSMGEALLEGGCRVLIGSGTCAEYTVGTGDKRQYREDDPVSPGTLYSAAKISAHLILAQLGRQAGAAVVWARLFNVFGPGEPSSRLLPSIAKAVLEQRTFAAGSGAQIRDYVQVRDVATALATCLEGTLIGAVNVCSAQPLRLEDLMVHFAQACGGGADSIELGTKPDRAWDPPFIVGDNRRLIGAGWKPQDIHDSLAAYAEVLVSAFKKLPLGGA